MSRPRPLNRAERAAVRLALADAPRNVWTTVHTGLGDVYPCRCRDGAPCDGRPDATGQPWCPCHGRTDRLRLLCCARLSITATV